MRVGIFYYRMEGIGGVENYILWTARGLVARGHQVTVACQDARPSLVEHYRRWGFELQAPEALRGLDVVNVHNSPGWRYYLTLADAPPAVVSIHEPPRDLYEEEMDYHFLRSPINRERRPWTRVWDRMMRTRARRIDRECIARYGRLLTDSRYIADKVREIYGRDDATPVPFGIDTKDMQTEAPPLQPPGYFFAVSRLTIVKNLQTAIAAVRQVPGARLVIAGEGDERPRLEKLAEGAPVTFAGGVSDEEKAVLLRDALALVHLPLDEPFGLVGLEAGLAGKPSIVSNHGGLIEIVAHEQTGLQVPPTDPGAVARAMRRLLENADRTRQMGEAARARVLASYSQQQYLDRMEAILHETAQARS
ncbi:MAG: glycosyltransferase family 4 protein [Candidatus Xenobia bacterium]